MKAYLIDPLTRTITEVEHDDSLESIYRHIDCDLFDAVRINLSDAIMVDDVGLLREDATERGFFLVRNYPSVLAGRGLVLGRDGGGNSTSPSISLAELRNLIDFQQ